MFWATIALALVSQADAHGYLSNPLPRSTIPTGNGPKTLLPVEAATWSSCSSSQQPDLGKGAKGYATFPAGSMATITWTITVFHNDNLPTTGITFYWRNNSNASDTFQSNNILGTNTIAAGANGNHSASVPIPDVFLADATLLWLWVSTDGGYYFGCADFKTSTRAPTRRPTMATTAPTSPTASAAPTNPTAAPTTAPTTLSAAPTASSVAPTAANDVSAGVATGPVLLLSLAAFAVALL